VRARLQQLVLHHARGQVGALCRLGADGAAGHIAQLRAFSVDHAKARGLQARINAQDAHGVSFQGKRAAPRRATITSARWAK
jgi:hypothetical protein